MPDPHLAHALDLLARDEDPRQHKLVPIDFKSLGVRQLGSIYEGLLEFKLRVADEKKAVVKEKRRDVYVSFKALGERERERAESLGRIVKKGQLYLENDKGERKATGSYYTPDHIVEYIVENAVGPIVAEKFEAMRPKLREAEQWHRERVKSAKAKGENPKKYESGPAVENQWHKLVNDLFNITVLDPAMGSGHFLVETVDYVTDKALAFLNSFPWNPVTAHLESVRSTILDEMEEQGILIDQRRLTDVNLLKRHVLKRCIYGVDLNPMAIELAKVSLWLHCFTLGAPLSFLDHHMRCGNSLIGVTVAEVQTALGGGESGQARLFGSQFVGLMLATDLMRHVGQLSDVTTAQLDESKTQYRKAFDALGPFKRLLDVYTSQWFRKERAQKRTTEAREIAFLVSERAAPVLKVEASKLLKLVLGLNKEEREIVEQTLRFSRQKRFFHWELEFPEVFYGPRPDTARKVERLASGGFDAVIGNPPYDVLSNEELGYDVSDDLSFYRADLAYKPAIRGKCNLYKLFICCALRLSSGSGRISFIVPMAILGDDQAFGVRRELLQTGNLESVEAFPQKDDPHRRVFLEAKLSTAVFVARAQSTPHACSIRTHPGALIDPASPRLTILPSDVSTFDAVNLTIPCCTETDWKLITRLLRLPTLRRMGQLVTSFQGEVNETNERVRGCLTDDRGGTLALRGSNVCLYAVREASQGEDIRVYVKRFLAGKPRDSKAFACESSRVGFQRSSPQNNFRRIIAARIPKGSFCLDTVSYVTDESSKINLDLLLLFLNSRILEWYFRIGSTNSKVNEYQFNALPILDPSNEMDGNPLCETLVETGKWDDLAKSLISFSTQPGRLPSGVAKILTHMSRCIQNIEQKRNLNRRSERSSLDSESQVIQDAADAVLFYYYGFSHEDSLYVSRRLEEML